MGIYDRLEVKCCRYFQLNRIIDFDSMIIRRSKESK